MLQLQEQLKKAQREAHAAKEDGFGTGAGPANGSFDLRNFSWVRPTESAMLAI